MANDKTKAVTGVTEPTPKTPMPGSLKNNTGSGSKGGLQTKMGTGNAR
jgi:hypothetical protein